MYSSLTRPSGKSSHCRGTITVLPQLLLNSRIPVILVRFSNVPSAPDQLLCWRLTNPREGISPCQPMLLGRDNLSLQPCPPATYRTTGAALSTPMAAFLRHLCLRIVRGTTLGGLTYWIIYPWIADVHQKVGV